MTQFIHLFLAPGIARVRGNYATALARAVPSTGRGIVWGTNGAFIEGDSIECLSGDAELAFGAGTAAQRLRSGGSSPGLPACVLLVQDGEDVRVFHRVHQTVRGVLYLCYHHETAAEFAPTPVAIQACLQRAEARWHVIRPLLSDDCAYSKWRPDIEMERKYTFRGIPETWPLICALHQLILEGDLAGFVPELDRDFQVFDYESHIFSVAGSPEDRGYISFIPQTDGRMTVKRKWFESNAEIRRESLYPNQRIPMAAIASRAAELARAPVVPLPSFRRKRFDVNFESLATGNVYGIYFDICSIVDRPSLRFAQCEVEYCRSRTFSPIRDVIEEFERVTAYTAEFLRRRDVAFDNDLYSKLDFVREAARHMGEALA